MIFSREVRWVVFIVAALTCGGPAWAKDRVKEKEKEPVAQKTAEKSKQAKLEAEKRAIEALNGTQWTIELSPMSGEQPKRPATDTVRFEGKKVASEKLSKEGFPSTNFTVTLGGDGVTVWETMQTAQDSSVAFWRGELHGEAMRGILSRHLASGKTEDWAFSGKLAMTPPLSPPETPAAARMPTPEKKPDKKTDQKR